MHLNSRDILRSLIKIKNGWPQIFNTYGLQSYQILDVEWVADSLIEYSCPGVEDKMRFTYVIFNSVFVETILTGSLFYRY
jgi:hypothetical protein